MAFCDTLSVIYSEFRGAEIKLIGRRDRMAAVGQHSHGLGRACGGMVFVQSILFGCFIRAYIVEVNFGLEASLQ
jgi:hypothetical protein